MSGTLGFFFFFYCNKETKVIPKSVQMNDVEISEGPRNVFGAFC